ncbi:multicopper oxidase domain-containing protein [Carbonactinospora thermoautotrophica]|nr:multicopper oxidase domain-containing protein [Carbonactinospora thermoautotrophica]
MAWLVLTVIATLTRDWLPVPRWLLVHLFLLGAVTNAILTWSEHFAVVLLRAPQPSARWSAIRLGALNAGVAAVLAGVVIDLPALTAAGAAAVVMVVGSHTVMLAVRVRRTLPSRFSRLVSWYVAAGAALVAGGTMGGLMAGHLTPGSWHERLHAAHVHANVLGWVGLTVLGTLFLLWPTVLRTRATDDVDMVARRALRVAVPGLALAVVGLLAANQAVAVAGLALYATAVALSLVPFVRTARRRGPHTAASWMIAAGTAWFAVVVLADLVLVARKGPALPPDPLVTSAIVGFVGQILLGALTYLLPVVLGGGPARLKATAATLERGWVARVSAVNAALPLIALPVPRPLALLGWAVVITALAAFTVLAVVALLQARGSRRVPRPSPAVAGIVVGTLLTAGAVGVAVSGAPRPQPVTVAGNTGTVTGDTRTVDVTLADMRIQPAAIDAAAGTRLVLRVTNRDAQRHDLRFATGEHTELLDPGETAVLRLPPLTRSVEAWCTVPGHRAAGMTLHVRVTGDGSGHHHGDDPGMPQQDAQGSLGGLDLSGPMSPGWRPYDATLRPAPGGTEHRVEIHAMERDLEVAPGVRQRMWTFNGTVPGPVLRGKVGDVFTVTFVNDGTMGHGIDFHAGALAPDGPMRTIQPGERLVYQFRADRAGAWLYHCSTHPMLQHIANGMYGAVIIDPPGLPRVDREYLLVQGELYRGEPGSQAQVANMREGRPDAWMFNGTAAGYDHAPLAARAGERVRVWVVAAGPASGTAFHIVGTRFDTVYKEGAYLLRKDDPGGAQVLDLAPAQGGFVETVFPEPGNYPFVDHDMRHAENGAHGLFRVTR